MFNPCRACAPLSVEKSAGPAVLVLKQSKGVTYGLTANHMESFAGDDARTDVSATFLQPFVSIPTPRLATFSHNTENIRLGSR